ncbi:DUF4179 domain-containing protein [Cohnella lupini]|uniref:Uncharacterized protein DUF4179 n=1 Tax=Cohnella lupini TaxID=1294267 RepID=A0A3D9HQA2_9BACL|nr:DUF4179 domain-containing protein [Cohnella lupini]RED51650.1 uncharacterized protein DUF4179 [Cohnella lupini]
MNDPERDQLIRQALVDEMHALPSIIREKMDDTYENLPNRRSVRRNRLVLQTAVLLVTLIICILSLGFISPVMANYLSNLPIIGSAFQSAGDIGLKQAGEELASTSTRQTITDKGVSITLDQVVYDGSRISIGFLHDSKVKFLDIDPRNIQISGSSVSSGYGLRNSEVAPGITATVLTTTVDQVLPNQFSLEIQIKHIQTWENDVKKDLKGDWSFKASVVKVLDGVIEKTFNPPLVKNLEGIKISLTEVAATPLTTRVSFDLVRPNDMEPEHIFAEKRSEGETTVQRELKFKLFDQQGKEISPLSVHGSASGDGIEHKIALFAPLGETQIQYLILRTYVITTPVKKSDSNAYVSVGQPAEKHLSDLDFVIPLIR